MPQNDLLRRYLDAGVAFTQMTRSRAEAIVKDLVKAGELQQNQAQKQVDDLMERSRKNTEQLLDMVRKEITTQLASMGIATKDDIARLEARLTSGRAGGAAAEPQVVNPPVDAPPQAQPSITGVTVSDEMPPASGPAKKTLPKKAGAKKATAKKAAAKKAAAPTEG